MQHHALKCTHSMLTFFSRIFNCQKSKLKFPWAEGSKVPDFLVATHLSPAAHKSRIHSLHPAIETISTRMSIPIVHPLYQPAQELFSPGQSKYAQQTQLLGTPGAPQTHSYLSINQQFNLKQPCLGALWHRSEDSVAQGTGMFPSGALVSALLLLPGADPGDG